MADTNIKWNGTPIDDIERDSLSLSKINENGTIREMVDTINANFLNIAKHGGGPAGIDGLDGLNGVDGSNVEYIYVLCDEMNPDVQYPTITKEIVNLFNSVKSAGSYEYKGIIWFDNAQPISLEHKNEYVWSRIKRGTGLAADWYYEPQPVLWAHWGEIGKDGDGVEYIFLASSNELTSISLNTSLLKIENMDDFQKAIFNIDDFYPGKKWFNSGNNKQKARLAISKKGLEISDSLFDTRWSQYFNFCSNKYSWTDEPTGTGPAVLYEYVSIRKSTIGENDIKMWGDFSTPALWSNYNLPTKSIIIYCNLNKNVTPKPPVGGWVDMSTGKLIVNKFGYELTPDYWKDTNNDIEEGQMTWMSNGVFDHTGKNAYWSYPVRITGKDGKDGEDGTLIEFIYALTAYGQQPDYPDIANKEQLDILFNDIEESTTSPKYSIYGSTKWYDRAQEISADIPVEYMAQRSKKHKETEWTYTEPIIWSHWGEDGTDGDGVEYIFAITKTNSNDGLVLPVYSSLNDSQKKIFQIDDFVPSEEWFNKPKSKQKAQEILGESFNNIEWSNYYGFNVSAKWSDNPTEVSPFVQYQWVSIRRSHADERTGDRFWEDFSTPVLWNNYSQTSMTFVVYCNMSDETTPKLPAAGWWNTSNDTLQMSKTNTNEYRSNALSSGTPDYTSYVGYWSDNNIDVRGTITWISTGEFNDSIDNNGSNNIYWSKPFRITGETGEPGEDGSNMQFVYALCDDKDSLKYPKNGSTTEKNNFFDSIESAGTNGYKYVGTTWYDHPQGIANEKGKRTEWVWSRSKPAGYPEITEWETPPSPVVWSHWGEDGTDGDGVEYIFARSTQKPLDSIDKPYKVSELTTDVQKVIYNINDFFPGEGWFTSDNKTIAKKALEDAGITLSTSQFNTQWNNRFNIIKTSSDPNVIICQWWDNPRGVDLEHPFEFVAIRKSSIDTEGKKVWGDFSDPALWSEYPIKSRTFIIYCNVNEGVTPIKPNETDFIWNVQNDSLVKNNSTSIWSDKDIDVPGKIAWLCSGLFAENGNVIFWSEPFRITGEEGKKGADGSNMQFVYALCDDKDSLKYPQNGSTTEKNNFFDSVKSAGTNGYKYAGTTWYDHPQGVLNENGKRTEWVWSRSKPAGYSEITQWETPQSAVVWSHWGEDGTDGDGVEYIFAITKTNSNNGLILPVYSSLNDSQKKIFQIDDFVPSEEWFNKPKSKQKAQEILGESFNNIEWSNYYGFNVSAKWSDNPIGVSPSTQYQWVSTRRSQADEHTGDRFWEDFSTPVLWNNYSKTSMTFVVYCNMSDETTPKSPVAGWWNTSNDTLQMSKTNSGGYKSNALSSGTPDYTSYVGYWSDNNIDVSGTITWISTGEFNDSIDNNGSNNIYWSKPFRITGETGKPGEDGSNMQFVYALSNIMPNFPGKESYEGKCNFFENIKQSVGGFVYNGTKWFDNPQGIEDRDGKRKEWVWSRNKSAGDSSIKWTFPESPVIWSHWGEDGTDGDGVEYMFLTSNSETYNTPTENNWNKVFDNFIGSTSDTVKYTYAMSDFLPTVVWLNTNKTAVQAKMQKDGKTFSESDWAGINTTISNANLGDLWKDNPSNINSNYKYQFVSIRKMNDGIWGPFSYPKLWSKYAIIKFKSIAFAATTIDTDLSRCTVTGGSFSNPLPTLTKKGNQTINVTWTDGPEPDASTGKTQIWMTSANVSEDSTSALVWSAPQKMTDATNLQVEWSSTDKSYTELASINQSLTQSKYNFGTFLKNNSYNENTAEFAWRITMSNDFNISFDDNSENAILMATCQLRNGVWSDWKITRVKGEKGDRGDKGDKGDKGDDGKPGNPGTPGEAGNGYQYKYIRYDNNTNYGGSTTCTVTNASSDNPVFKIGTVIVQSTDSAKGADSGHTYEYRSERYGHAGSWSNWSNPVIIARYLNDSYIGTIVTAEVSTATKSIQRSLDDANSRISKLSGKFDEKGNLNVPLSDSIASGYLKTDENGNLILSTAGVTSTPEGVTTFADYINYEKNQFLTITQNISTLEGTITQNVTSAVEDKITTGFKEIQSDINGEFATMTNTVAKGSYVTDVDGYLLVKESDGSRRRALDKKGNPTQNYTDVIESDKKKLIYVNSELATISQSVSDGIACTSIVTSVGSNQAIFGMQSTTEGSKIFMNADIIGIESKKYFRLDDSGLKMTGNLLAKDGSGNITAGVIGDDTAGNDIKFFAGTNAEILERSKAPFRVYEDGSIYASKGKVGPLNVQSRNIYIGNYDENHYTRIDEDGIEIKNDNFVSRITASNIDMYGSFKRRCAYLIGNLSNSNWEGEGSSNAAILEILKNKYEIYSSNSYNLTNVIKKYDLINTISCRNVTIPSDPAFIGRHLTLMTGNPLSPYICEIVKNNGLNYELSVTGTDTFMFSDSQNCKFYENGGKSSTLKLSNEGVDLFGIGINNEFKGFIVSNRFNINTEYDYGSTFRCLGMFCFNEKKLIGSYTFNGKSGTITTGNSYVTISTPFNVNDSSKIFVDITPVGNTITGLTYNSEINLNNTILTITIYSSEKGIKSEFRVLVYNLGDFSTLTSDSTTPPAIIKEEYKRTGSSMPYQNIGMTGLIFSCQKSESYNIRIYVNGPTKRVDYALSAGGSDFTFTPDSHSKTTPEGTYYQSTTGTGDTYIYIGDVATSDYNNNNSYNIGSIRITLYETEFLTSTTEGVTLYIPLEQDYEGNFSDDGRS